MVYVNLKIYKCIRTKEISLNTILVTKLLSDISLVQIHLYIFKLNTYH